MEATVTKAGPQEVLMKVTTRDLQNKRLIAMVQIVAHAPSAMVLFFLFLFLPLTFAFLLTAVAVLCKPGCAVSAADTSSV